MWHGQDKAAVRSSRKSWRSRAVAAGVVGFLCISPMASLACSGTHGMEDQLAASEAKYTQIEKAWGIAIQGVRLTAADYMLDFRYRVVDPEKAARLHGLEIKPYLIDAESGSRLGVPSSPKIGTLRQGTKAPVKDKTYFMLFANPGRFVKQGGKVTLVLGDLVVRDIAVR